jgi:hypothetical protein
MQTVRGCVASCTFCSVRSFYGKGVRAISAKRFLSEIDYLYNDLGIKVYEPYKKRWHGFYTSLGHASGDSAYARNRIRLDVENSNRPKPETIYYNVDVNNDKIKLDEIK